MSWLLVKVPSPYSTTHQPCKPSYKGHHTLIGLRAPFPPLFSHFQSFSPQSCQSCHRHRIPPSRVISTPSPFLPLPPLPVPCAHTHFHPLSHPLPFLLFPLSLHTSCSPLGLRLTSQSLVYSNSLTWVQVGTLCYSAPSSKLCLGS